MPLTRSGAEDVIKEIVRPGMPPMKRGQIIARVHQLHVERGGLPTSNADVRVKKALDGLLKMHELWQPEPGYYARTTVEQQQQLDADEEDQDTEHRDDLEEETDESDRAEETGDVSSRPPLTAECETGKGDQCVYVYYFKTHRELAELRGEVVWPCKIGCTKTLVEDRILEHGARTAMSEYPIVGLVIKSANADRLEHLIHTALTMAGRKTQDSPGAEWFTTTPEAIRRWVEAFEATLNLF
jgi:hypothetical protein